MASQSSDFTQKRSNYITYTKICSITNCENNRGNSNVQMFRIPNDDRQPNWIKAIAGHSDSHKGFICIKHFDVNDLSFSKNSKRIELKKNTIPKIFNVVLNERNYLAQEICDEIVPELAVHEIAQGAINQSERSEPSEAKHDDSCMRCFESHEILKAEYANLRQEFIELEAKRCVEVADLQNEIRKLKMNAEIQKEHIKYLSGKTYRQEKSVQTLKDLLKDLKKQSVLSEEGYAVLEKIDKNEILKCIMYGQPILTKYPKEVRQFCFALNYHSPAAYRIVRNQFDKYLPHPQTLIAWMQESDLNGEHGIKEETMKRLEGFTKDLKDATGEQLICALIFDEIHLKKQVYWDQNKFEYAGYPTYISKEDAAPKGAKGPKERKKGATRANQNDNNCQVANEGECSTKRVTRAAAAAAAATTNSNRQENILENDSIEAIDGGELITKDNQMNPQADKKKKPKSPLANRAIVFMLSGINKSFQFPVGYHFVNGIGGLALSELVTEVIIKVSQCGVIISNLTFDGAKDNIKMCEILGANLDPLSDNFKPHIISPYDGRIIFLIFDVSHMEKLMRNLLGNHGILFDENDAKIEWKYFVDLQEISKDGNFLTHKLTKKHTKEFQRNKMNVRLAVETYSTSVADSLQILREKGHAQFVDSYGTEIFTRRMDKMFDIFNSRDTRHTNKYKQPLNLENKREIFEFIEESIVSLKGLHMNKVRKNNGVEKTIEISVLKTINKTPVLGFLVNLTNLPQMFAHYVERNENDSLPQKMTHLRTYALSQDHIELFFGKIRARNGHNNNPNCAQFKGAYRRLLANIEINPPTESNCMMFEQIDLHKFAPQSNVYTVSSRRPKLDILSDDSFQSNLKQFEKKQENLEALSDVASMRGSNHLLDGFGDASIAYASKLIEESIAGAQFNCECCKFIFDENEKLNDRTICLIPSKRPCTSTYNICRIVDKYMDAYKPNKEGNVKDVDFRVIYYKVFQDIDYNKIFVSTNFKDHEHHRFYLVKMIVQNYLYIKTAQIAKEVTYEEYDKIIRSKLTKWIHFKGQ